MEREGVNRTLNFRYQVCMCMYVCVWVFMKACARIYIHTWHTTCSLQKWCLAASTYKNFGRAPCSAPARFFYFYLATRGQFFFCLFRQQISWFRNSFLPWINLYFIIEEKNINKSFAGAVMSYLQTQTDAPRCHKFIFNGVKMGVCTPNPNHNLKHLKLKFKIVRFK